MDQVLVLELPEQFRIAGVDFLEYQAISDLVAEARRFFNGY